MIFGVIDESEEMVSTKEEKVIRESFEILLLQYRTSKYANNADKLKNYFISQGATSVENYERYYIVEYQGYDFKINKNDFSFTVETATPGPEIVASVEQGSSTYSAIIKAEVTNGVEVDSIKLIDWLGTEYTMSLDGNIATYTVSNNGRYKIIATTTTNEEEGEKKTATCYIEVNQITTTFSTSSGRIDIIWIDKNNNVIYEPLSPVLGDGMTGVYWDDTRNEITVTQQNKSNWYNYQSVTGTGANTSSKWANAINTSTGEYFVWIPRYAYRIIYTSSNYTTNVVGYCDGLGIRTVSGEVKYELDAGVETVEYDGYSYIVHPAFETNLDLGGWDSDLSGFWAGKDVKTTSSSKYIKSSYKTCFENDRTNESHMIKMSEFGAIAYLTYSPYGLNGTNNLSTSSTGNIHGIRGMTTQIYLAAFNDQATNYTTYGSDLINAEKKYATVYSSNRTSNSITLDQIYSIGKIGDATKEVVRSTTSLWESSSFRMLYQGYPYLKRGGSGLFYTYYSNGYNDIYNSRIILCP